jgi:paraquat-inducible protein B
MQKDATKFLKSGTQFWLRGADPSISDPASLSALLSGPTIVMEPGPGKTATHFAGLTQKPVVTGAHGPPRIYGVSFTGPVGELKPGEAVKLRGFEVGEVKDIGFHYDAATGAIVTPVTLALYPALFHIEDTAGTTGGAAQASDAAIDSLIRKGFRAKLERDPPLIGAPRVTLELAPEASGKPLAVVDGVPQIPAAPDSGIGSVVERINRLPIEEIGQNVRDATRHVDTLVSSAQLEDAVTQLDASLKQLHQVMTGAGPEIPKLLSELRKAADQIDGAAKAAESTARSADQIVGGAASQNSLQDAIRELTGAARSVRDLVSYLDRHPEALVQGRSGQ